MDELAWLAERFEEHRARLKGMAYRMLGSLTEADDAVQMPGCASVIQELMELRISGDG